MSPTVSPGLDWLATAVVLLDRVLHVKYVNPAAETLFAASRKSILDQPFPGLFADSGSLAALLHQAIREERGFADQDLILVPTGQEPLHLDCIVTPVELPQAALLLELRPIDQRLRIEREEQRMNQHQANRELIRNLVHEIKNPLGGLRGSAQLLERELDRPNLREYTRVIIKEADRLQALMDRLLTPHRPPNHLPMNIHEVCERVRSLVLAEFPAGIGVERDYDVSLPEFRGDPEQLIQAVLNIARNAAQAILDDGPGTLPAGRGKIVLRTRITRQVVLARRLHRLALELQVIDNGPGVPPEIRDKIFYPLVSGREGGTGLGLTFAQTTEAIEALSGGVPQVLVSDIRMPGTSGLELLQNVKQRFPNLPVIIMTAYSDLESAVAAFQGGAFEYLPKPFDVDQAVELIRRALGESVREGETEESLPGTPDILGQAQSMQEVFRAVGRLSQSSATVLITGESGTGKELVARALHRHSPRADKPFIAINTAAMPKDLLESELFGHERGAFTGAQALRRGRFEQAEGGTLFLDEIGDMPAELQTRLLRVLSDGTFYRVGGHQPIRASVRVIAATNQELEARVREGLFREDLYHRLNVIRLRLPSLRERREDIPLLARHFLAKSARELGVDGKRLTDAAVQFFTAQEWPGNVRQLENVCHWVTVMAPGQVVDVKDLPPEVRGEGG